MRLASGRFYRIRFSEHLCVTSMVIPTRVLVMLIVLEGLNNLERDLHGMWWSSCRIVGEEQRAE